MPSVIASAPAEAAGEVADERREDDQRRGQHAADREPVDELAVGQPVASIDRALLEEGDDRVRATERDEPRLQPLKSSAA